MTKSFLQDILTATLLILCGGSLYIVFRQEIAGLEPLRETALLETVRLDPAPLKSHAVGRLVLYTLPDMLWYASLLLFQTAFTGRNRAAISLWITCAISPFAWETCQAAGVIEGTGDIADITGYTLTLIIIALCKRKKLSSLFSSW